MASTGRGRCSRRALDQWRTGLGSAVLSPRSTNMQGGVFAPPVFWRAETSQRCRLAAPARLLQAMRKVSVVHGGEKVCLRVIWLHLQGCSAGRSRTNRRSPDGQRGARPPGCHNRTSSRSSRPPVLHRRPRTAEARANPKMTQCSLG